MYFFRNYTYFLTMEKRTLVVMAAMGLLNICFGLVDSIQVTHHNHEQFWAEKKKIGLEIIL